MAEGKLHSNANADKLDGISFAFQYFHVIFFYHRIGREGDSLY